MSLNLDEMLRLDVSALSLFVRTSVTYLGLLIALRVITRREMGSFELPDLLLLVLIADGVQNAMAGEYRSVTGGLIVAGTLIGWNYLLDVLTYRFALARRILRPAPLKLVEDGRMLRRNMRRELVTVDELLGHLRVQGIEDLREVKLVYMEADGELSVVRRGKSDEPAAPARRRTGAGA